MTESKTTIEIVRLSPHAARIYNRPDMIIDVDCRENFGNPYPIAAMIAKLFEDEKNDKA